MTALKESPQKETYVVVLVIANSDLIRHRRRGGLHFPHVLVPYQLIARRVGNVAGVDECRVLPGGSRLGQCGDGSVAAPSVGTEAVLAQVGNGEYGHGEVPHRGDSPSHQHAVARCGADGVGGVGALFVGGGTVGNRGLGATVGASVENGCLDC